MERHVEPDQDASFDIDGRYRIEDIARRAGVSISTVSRVLNGRPDVAARTRTRVQAVIDELGYVPDASARDLAGGGSRSIALLFPEEFSGLTQLELGFFVGAANAAAQRDMVFHLLTQQPTRGSLLRLARGRQLQGIILMQIRMRDWRVELLRGQRFPLVLIGRCAENDGVSFIDLDFEAAADIAVKHLVNLGHNAIGYLARPAFMRERGIGSAVRSLDGFIAAADRYAVAATYREITPSIDEAREATVSMLEEQPAVSAIVTSSGTTAVGVYQALQRKGREVPTDASVISISSDRIATMASPSLTNVDFPTDTMGYRAAEMLIDAIRNPDHAPRQELLSPNLIQRESTKRR